MNDAPWHERGLELEAEHGPYCFFAAFEEWIAKNDDKDVFGTLDSLDKVFLFSLFEKACEETRCCDEPNIVEVS